MGLVILESSEGKHILTIQVLMLIKVHIEVEDRTFDKLTMTEFTM